MRRAQWSNFQNVISAQRRELPSSPDDRMNAAMAVMLELTRVRLLDKGGIWRHNSREMGTGKVIVTCRTPHN